MPIILPSSNVVSKPAYSYDNLDENGHTPGDIACFNDPNCDMNHRLIELLGQDINGTGAGTLPEVSPPSDGVPSWLILLGSFAIGWIVLERVGR